MINEIELAEAVEKKKVFYRFFFVGQKELISKLQISVYTEDEIDEIRLVKLGLQMIGRLKLQGKTSHEIRHQATIVRINLDLRISRTKLADRIIKKS